MSTHGKFGMTWAIRNSKPLLRCRAARGPIQNAATSGNRDNGHAPRRKQRSGVDSWQAGRYCKKHGRHTIGTPGRFFTSRISHHIDSMHVLECVWAPTNWRGVRGGRRIGVPWLAGCLKRSFSFLRICSLPHYSCTMQAACSLPCMMQLRALGGGHTARRGWKRNVKSRPLPLRVWVTARYALAGAHFVREAWLNGKASRAIVLGSAGHINDTCRQP